VHFSFCLIFSTIQTYQSPHNKQSRLKIDEYIKVKICEELSAIALILPHIYISLAIILGRAQLG